MKTYGQQLLQVRKSRSMTQKELSEAVGIKQPAISSYENDLHEPKISCCIKIADTLCVSIDELLGRESKPISKKSCRQHREMKNLTINMLSEKSGVSCVTIGRVELGTRNALISTIECLADALGIGIDDYINHEARYE